MSASDVDGLLNRLVSQFESPYDFLREVVQNAMDAGSDRLEVTLDMHADEGSTDPDAVVFELTMMDTGGGMDQAIIDEELTRLFSSGKSGDRTMAGGFGVGFVSVFAWKPEAVLLQTGRAGEAWELIFHGDRRFEKLPVDQPLEGTTLILFRSGRAAEREAIAEAIRDSLWRWCRYCPLELSFEDLHAEEPPELIQDSPAPEDAAVTVVHQTGDSLVRVSLAVPGRVVLLRRGLILAEGSAEQQLPGIYERVAASASHLRIWADSPSLRATISRDKVVDDEGRAQVEKRILELVETARVRLVDKIEAEADELEPWTRARHERYGMLHAHLGLEYGALSGTIRDRKLLRRLDGRSCTPREFERANGAWPMFVASSLGAGDPDARMEEELLTGIGSSKLPVLEGDLLEDEPWLSALAAHLGCELVSLDGAASRVEPIETGRGLCGIVEGILQQCGISRIGARLCQFIDGKGRSVGDGVFGPQFPGASIPIALHGSVRIPAKACRDSWLWLNTCHPLVEQALRTFDAAPFASGLVLAAQIHGSLIDSEGAPLDPKQLDAAARELRQGEGAKS
jgi:hypothetical protein